MDFSDPLSSKGFKRSDTNVNGALKNYFLTHYSHYLVPGINRSRTPSIHSWRIDDVLELYQEFPYSCDLPKPLLPPVKITHDVLNKGDPALQLIATKTQIENDVKRVLDYYQKHKNAFVAIPLKKDVKWKINSKNMITNLPRYVADLADMIEMDPDPYFAGAYNWYYTGGSLSSLQLGGENLLIFPYMNALVAAPMISKNSIWRTNLRSGVSRNVDCVIYETRNNVQGDSCRILGRSKKKCFFYSLTERDEGLRLIEIHNQESKIPYISADFDPANCNKFCTINVDRNLILWDMNSRKSIRKNTIDIRKTLEDKWGNLRFMKSDPNTIIFVDRCCLHYIDTRHPYERPVLSLCPKENLESCESLCSFAPSRSENHNYVASYHSLLMCDRRSPHSSVEQKWIHQFKSPPLFSIVETRDEKEVVVLSSQISGEIAVILNTWDNYDNPHSYNLPYGPPSILDTLTKCRLQGKCFDPFLKKRLELCTSGNCFAFDENGHLSLFLQNSIGDIFYQCITHEESLDDYSLINCQALSALEAWEKRTLLHERLITPLVVTDRTDMTHAFENFTNKILRLQPEVAEPEFFRDPVWKKKLEQLKEYVDLLAPELLSVWDVTEVNIPTVQTAIPHQKVLNWLEYTGSKYVEESQENIDLTMESINTQELFSVSQKPEVIDIAEDAPHESIYPPVKVKTVRKTQTKKRTFVAGF